MRLPEKPTERQKHLASIIGNEIKSLAGTNDLGSPTIASDFREMLQCELYGIMESEEIVFSGLQECYDKIVKIIRNNP